MCLTRLRPAGSRSIMQSETKTSQDLAEQVDAAGGVVGAAAVLFELVLLGVILFGRVLLDLGFGVGWLGLAVGSLFWA